MTFEQPQDVQKQRKAFGFSSFSLLVYALNVTSKNINRKTK